MPLDPSISLDVTKVPDLTVKQPPAGNPLSLVQSMAETAQSLNAVKQFQQTYAARQKAGQIMAAAPDLESGVKALQADPSVVGFVPEIASAATGMLSTMQTYRGEQQKQGLDAFGHIASLLPAMLEDPKSFAPAASAYINTIQDPVVRASVLKSSQYLEQAITGELPGDPAAARAEMAKRMIGLGIATGSADAMQRVWGAPATMDVGGQIQPGVQAPAQGQPDWVGGAPGGSFQPGGGAFAKTLAPQVTEPGKPVVGGQYGTGGVPTDHAAPAQPGEAAGDGKPLIPEGADLRAPNSGTGTGGAPVLSAQSTKIAGQLADEYGAGGQRAWSNATASIGLLSEMDRDFDQMIHETGGKGFLVPGAGADLRLSLAKGVNTLSSIFGDKDLSKELPFDPNKIASAEQLVKDTRRMGITLLTTMLGNQREAAQTIQNITEAVPGINNTYLGAKLLIGSIRASTQRIIDERKFQNTWLAQPENQGNLIGADVAFNKLHPADGYVNQVMDQFGLTPEGFKSPQDVGKAVAAGLLTKAQATDILYSQFPDQFKRKE